MIEITTIEKAAELNKPRRIIKYVLLYCQSGKLDIVIDEKDFTLSAGEVVTITSGQIHYIKKSTDAKGYALEFTLGFFAKNDNDIELIFHNGLFCHFAMNEVISLKNTVVPEELEKQPYQYLISVHSRVELILVEINRAKVEQGNEIWKPDALFLKFLELVRDNFERNYTLADFAQMLGTTEGKLNEQSKLHAGKTAQNVIFNLTISEAKRLLLYESQSVKEVAYKLGFNDPFYFSNFFKKHTQLSPKAYQEKNAL
jgi:AraC family transcriptional regulator, transcriptional activator of pobA